MHEVGKASLGNKREALIEDALEMTPDINLLDYWFWGTLNARVFHRNAPSTLEDLKRRRPNVDECSQFSEEELSAAVNSLWLRCKFSGSS